MSREKPAIELFGFFCCPILSEWDATNNVSLRMPMPTNKYLFNWFALNDFTPRYVCISRHGIVLPAHQIEQHNINRVRLKHSDVVLPVCNCINYVLRTHLELVGTGASPINGCKSRLVHGQWWWRSEKSIDFYYLIKCVMQDTRVKITSICITILLIPKKGKQATWKLNKTTAKTIRNRSHLSKVWILTCLIEIMGSWCYSQEVSKSISFFIIINLLHRYSSIAF